MRKTKYVRDLAHIRPLSDADRTALQPVTDKFKFRANDYYLGLINWDDPNDPIRKIIVPQISELSQSGALDASNEQSNYVAPGCQHKYPHTALLLCIETCGGYCRFCFRKRLFMDDNDEVVNDISEGIAYIRDHPAINNVLLTGGDPLLLSTRKLEKIIRPLRQIEHVRLIRIGSKIPAFDPYRIINDPELPAMLARYSTRHRRIYLMAHFNTAREITDTASLGLDLLVKAGVVITNQTPVLRGINDSPAALRQLMNELSYIGVPPYYFFQCRPTRGNEPYELPLVQAYRSLEEAKKGVSGLAKRARLVMSHARGKIEVVGLTRHNIYLRYHRARHPEDEGRFMSFYRDDKAKWLDDLVPSDGATERILNRRPGQYPEIRAQ
jgi:KamA family protein